MVAMIPQEPVAAGVPMRYSNAPNLTALVGVKSRLAGVRTRLVRLEEGVLSVYSAADDVSAPLAVARVSEALSVSSDAKRGTVYIRTSRKRRVTLVFKGDSAKLFEEWSTALARSATLRVDAHYKLYAPIGKGHYAVVHEAMDRRTGEKVAVKVISKRHADAKTLQHVRREAEIARIVDHPHIVRTVDLFETEDRLFVVMELCEGGNLLKYLSGKGRINERNARRLAHQLLSAVSYLHDRSIIHRDIKPENVLVDGDGNLKLADFGLARVLDGVTSEEFCLSSILGTPAYCSPEVVAKTQYGMPIDVYGCGVLLYIALSGALPFKGQTPADVFKAILAGDVQFPPVRWAMVSDAAKDFVQELLSTQGKDRPTAAQALAHPWLSPAGRRPGSSNDSLLARNLSGRSDSGFGRQHRSFGRNARSLRASSVQARAFCRAPSGSLEELERNRRARSV